MEGTARRVAVFFGAGALLAALVGVTVWATSTPGHTNRAGFTAEAAGTTEPSATDTTVDSATDAATDTATDTAAPRVSNATRTRSGRSVRNAGQSDNTAAQPVAAPSGYSAERDPYLPPHAVVEPAPRSAQPSRVYRPSNIVPSPTSAASQAATSPAAEPTSAATQGQTGVHTSPDPTQGNGRPGDAQGGSPVSPVPGSSPVQPSEASEPARPAPAEPSQSPSRPQHGGIREGLAPDAGAVAPGETPGPHTAHGAQHEAATATSVTLPTAAEDAGAETGDHQAAASPTRVPGKEDVAGYPHEKQQMTARDVIDKFTARVTQ